VAKFRLHQLLLDNYSGFDVVSTLSPESGQSGTQWEWETLNERSSRTQQRLPVGSERSRLFVS